jgi:hypothetical protein
MKKYEIRPEQYLVRVEDYEDKGRHSFWIFRVLLILNMILGTECIFSLQ